MQLSGTLRAATLDGEVAEADGLAESVAVVAGNPELQAALVARLSIVEVPAAEEPKGVGAVVAKKVRRPRLPEEVARRRSTAWAVAASIGVLVTGFGAMALVENANRARQAPVVVVDASRSIAQLEGYTGPVNPLNPTPRETRGVADNPSRPAPLGGATATGPTFTTPVTIRIVQPGTPPIADPTAAGDVAVTVAKPTYQNAPTLAMPSGSSTTTHDMMSREKQRALVIHGEGGAGSVPALPPLQVLNPAPQASRGVVGDLSGAGVQFGRYGEPYIQYTAPIGGPFPGGGTRDVQDGDHGKSATIGMSAPGVFSADLDIPLGAQPLFSSIPRVNTFNYVTGGFGGGEYGGGGLGGFGGAPSDNWGTGYFEYAPQGSTATVRDLTLRPNVQEAQTGRFMLGVGINSNAGLLGSIVLDEQNADLMRRNGTTAAPNISTGIVDRPTSVRVDVGAVNVFTRSGSAFAASVPAGMLGESLTKAGAGRLYLGAYNNTNYTTLSLEGVAGSLSAANSLSVAGTPILSGNNTFGGGANLVSEYSGRGRSANEYLPWGHEQNSFTGGVQINGGTLGMPTANARGGAVSGNVSGGTVIAGLITGNGGLPVPSPYYGDFQDSRQISVVKREGTTSAIGNFHSFRFVGDGFDDDLADDNVYGRFGRDPAVQQGLTFTNPLDGIPNRTGVFGTPGAPDANGFVAFDLAERPILQRMDSAGETVNEPREIELAKRLKGGTFTVTGGGDLVLSSAAPSPALPSSGVQGAGTVPLAGEMNKGRLVVTGDSPIVTAINGLVIENKVRIPAVMEAAAAQAGLRTTPPRSEELEKKIAAVTRPEVEFVEKEVEELTKLSEGRELARLVAAKRQVVEEKLVPLLIREKAARQESRRSVSAAEEVKNLEQQVLAATSEIEQIRQLQETEARRVRLWKELEDRAGSEMNTDSFDAITENPFVRPTDEPLSTFSIDVDTASYSIVRGMLNRRTRPPRGAVRLEEFINYFPYDYPQPEGDDPFSVNTEAARCPWNADHVLVRVGLKGKEIHRKERPASNLVFLVDVSGSMQDGNKLPWVRESLKMLTRELGDSDRVAIVVYAGNTGLVLPSTGGNRKPTILDAIDRLEAGGSTNGGAGIELAYAVATENFIKGGVNRVILATDGDFNVGVTSQADLVDLIERKAKTGVFFSALGYGMGNLKDSTLEKLADKGNGNYAYIDTLKEAEKSLVEQMSGTLVTIAKDVKIQIEFNPKRVAGYRLLGYENRMLAAQDFNDDTKDAGEIGAGHTVTALYELIPAGKEGKREASKLPKVDELKYQQSPTKLEPTGLKLTDAAESKEMLTLKLRYKEPDGKTSKLIERTLRDDVKDYAKASGEFKFAAGVASFGMVLRRSAYRGTATFDAALELAQEGLGKDPHGYRAELLDLIRLAKQIVK
jgi:Ca-activated chloride channel family protein